MPIAIDTLAYARALREAGFSERQAEGQAQALAAAMTDSLATKQDLRELELRIDARFERVDSRFGQVNSRFDQVDARFEQVNLRFEHLEKQFDTRLVELERRMEIRFGEQAALLDGRLADLERRVTVRMLAGIGVVSALVKLL